MGLLGPIGPDVLQITGRRKNGYPRPGTTFRRPGSNFRRRRPSNRKPAEGSKGSSAVRQEVVVGPQPTSTPSITTEEWGVPDLSDSLFSNCKSFIDEFNLRLHSLFLTINFLNWRHASHFQPLPAVFMCTICFPLSIQLSFIPAKCKQVMLTMKHKTDICRRLNIDSFEDIQRRMLLFTYDTQTQILENRTTLSKMWLRETTQQPRTQPRT